MHTQKIHNLKELKEQAQKLVQEIKKPQIILLEGALSAGKTQLIRFMGEFLEVPSYEICSPSFSLINHYKSPQGPVIHVDLFRLKNKEDLESTGFWDIFTSPQIVFIEWADLLKEELPQKWNKLHISLKIISPEARTIQWQSV